MIRVTVWYEYVQEAGEFNEEFLPKDMSVEEKARLKKRVADVAAKDKRSLIQKVSWELWQSIWNRVKICK